MLSVILLTDILPNAFFKIVIFINVILLCITFPSVYKSHTNKTVYQLFVFLEWNT